MTRYRLSFTVDVDEAELARHRRDYPNATPRLDDPNTWTPGDLSFVMGDVGQDRRFWPVRGTSLVEARRLRS